MSAMETATFFEKRGATGGKIRADEAWKKVSNRAPVAEDKW